MGSEWYYHRDGQEFGPIGSAQLMAMATAGELRPDDLVWREGRAEWVAAKEIRQLGDLMKGVAPVPRKQTQAAAPASAPSTQLVFEDRIGGWTWVLALVGVLLFIGLLVGSMPPNRGRKIGLALMSALLVLFCGALTVVSFQKRNDVERYFADRVEVYRSGRLLHKLRYDDVHCVSYGRREPNEHVLFFSGRGKQPRMNLSFSGDGKKGKTGELDEPKLMWLRDTLHAIVCGRMLNDAQTPDGAQWFGDFYLTAKGLIHGDSLIPWHQLIVQANDSTGDVQIQSRGKMLGRTSMIEDNVVPGLITIEQLKSA